MDWVNSLREILNFPLIVSLLTVIATLYVSYKLSMRRERTLKIVERHSNDLRALTKRWTKEVPNIEFVGSPLTKKPTILEAPVEHEYLFEDLKKHIPADMKLLEAWQQFKEDYNQFNEDRFSLFQEIVKNLKEKLKLPYTPKWGRHGFSNHFVKARALSQPLQPD